MTPNQTDWPTDAHLLSSGQPDDFMVVSERHAPLLRSWLRVRLRDGDLAAEVLAETLAAAWVGRMRFRDPGDGSAAPWLFGIAAKQVALFWRRRRVETVGRERLGMTLRRYEADAFEESEERLELAAYLPELRAALAALPAEQRQLLNLRIVDELDYVAVAGHLGITEGAARTRMSRALSNLRSVVLGGDRC